jgi:hypothetical protein
MKVLHFLSTPRRNAGFFYFFFYPLPFAISSLDLRVGCLALPISAGQPMLYGRPSIVESTLCAIATSKQLLNQAFSQHTSELCTFRNGIFLAYSPP